MAEQPHVTLDHATPSYAIGTWKRVLIWVVEGHTPLATLETLRRRMSVLARDRGEEKHVAITILYATDSAMSAEERQCVARMIEDTQHLRLASSTAVLARGLMGAVHRSILTGLSIVAPPPHPNRITATIDDAIAFVHPYVIKSSGSIAIADVRRMVDVLYDELRTRRGERRA